MKYAILTAAMMGSIGFSAAAQMSDGDPNAFNGWYADIGLATFDVDSNDGGTRNDVSVGGIIGHLGYSITRNFGIEGEVAFGSDGDETIIEGVRIESELKTSFGAFGRANLPLGDRVNLFGRVGFVNIEYEATAPGSGVDTIELSESGAAYGAGIEVYVYDGFGARLGYTRYDTGDIESDSIALGFSYKF